MSLHTITSYEIRCDYPACRNSFVGQVGLPMDRLRVLMQERGWRRRYMRAGGKDYCPTHSFLYGFSSR